MILRKWKLFLENFARSNTVLDWAFRCALMTSIVVLECGVCRYGQRCIAIYFGLRIVLEELFAFG